VDHPDQGEDRVPGGVGRGPGQSHTGLLDDDHLATLEQLRNDEVGGVRRG
jgi:hypothetical protein